MIVEAKVETLGFVLPDLDEIYRTNRSGARFLSHFAVQNVLYLNSRRPWGMPGSRCSCSTV